MDIPVESSEDIRVRYEAASAAGLQSGGYRSAASFFRGRDINLAMRHMVDAGLPGYHDLEAPGNNINADAGIYPFVVPAAVVPRMGIADGLGEPEGAAPAVPPPAEGVAVAGAFQARAEELQRRGVLTDDESLILIDNYDASKEWLELTDEQLKGLANAFIRAEAYEAANAGNAPFQGGEGAGAGAGARAGGDGGEGGDEPMATPKHKRASSPVESPEEASMGAMVRGAKNTFDTSVRDIAPYKSKSQPLAKDSLSDDEKEQVTKALLRLFSVYKKTLGKTFESRTPITKEMMTNPTTARHRAAASLYNRTRYYSKNVMFSAENPLDREFVQEYQAMRRAVSNS